MAETKPCTFCSRRDGKMCQRQSSVICEECIKLANAAMARRNDTEGMIFLTDYRG